MPAGNRGGNHAGYAAVRSAIAAILAGADAIRLGLHPIHSPILPLGGGGIAATDRFAQRLDERGPVTGGGVAIPAGPDPVYRVILHPGDCRRLAGSVEHLRIPRRGVPITRLGSPVTSLRSNLTAQCLSEELVYVERACAALAVPIVGGRVAPVCHAIAQVDNNIPGVGGGIPRVAVYLHRNPPGSSCSGAPS